MGRVLCSLGYYMTSFQKGREKIMSRKLKKYMCIFASLFCACSFMLSLASTTYATNTPQGADEVMLEDSSQMRYYPFVYSEDEDFAWARELIGDCSACVPGYLYVQDLTTMELWKVLDFPVDYFRSSGDILFCVVDGGTIIQTNYWGTVQTTLYHAGGDIANMEYDNGTLLFSVDDRVIRLNLKDNSTEQIAVCENITFLFPLTDTSFVWANAEEETYRHTVDVGNEAVDLPKLFAEEVAIEPPISMQVPLAAASGPVSFPLPEYAPGTYFTNDRKKCESHEDCIPTRACNCKNYRASIQCVGFAKYAFDRYSNLYPASGSWYSDANAHSNATTRSFNSDADVKRVFTELGYGAYMWVSKRTDRVSGPVHAFVTAGSTSSTVTIYEGNADGQCKVELNTYTFAQFRAIYDYVSKSVAHKFTGTAQKYSASYHKVPCSYGGCSGYILQTHYAQTPGPNVRCLGCGYVGNIRGGMMSVGGSNYQ